MLTVRQLIDTLKECQPDDLIVMYSDAEGNEAHYLYSVVDTMLDSECGGGLNPIYELDRSQGGRSMEASKPVPYLYSCAEKTAQIAKIRAASIAECRPDSSISRARCWFESCSRSKVREESNLGFPGPLGSSLCFFLPPPFPS